MNSAAVYSWQSAKLMRIAPACLAALSGEASAMVRSTLDQQRASDHHGKPPAAPPPRLLPCQQDALVDLQFELLVKKLLLPASRMELQRLLRIRVNENPI